MSVDTWERFKRLVIREFEYVRASRRALLSLLLSLMASLVLAIVLWPLREQIGSGWALTAILSPLLFFNLGFLIQDTDQSLRLLAKALVKDFGKQIEMTSRVLELASQAFYTAVFLMTMIPQISDESLRDFAREIEDETGNTDVGQLVERGIAKRHSDPNYAPIELIQQALKNWIEIKNRTTSNGRAGRPTNAAYDLAYDRLAKGEDEDQVFRDYCHQTGLSYGDSKSRDAFKRAMRDRRAKGGERRN